MRALAGTCKGWTRVPSYGEKIRPERVFLIFFPPRRQSFERSYDRALTVRPSFALSATCCSSIRVGLVPGLSHGPTRASEVDGVLSGRGGLNKKAKREEKKEALTRFSAHRPCLQRDIPLGLCKYDDDGLLDGQRGGSGGESTSVW
jgi:hypothetical protein